MGAAASPQAMLRRDVHFRYLRPYLDNNGEKLKQQYGDNMRRFIGDYQVPAEMIDSLKAFAARNEVTINEEEFQKDLDFTRTRLKAHLARHIWSNDGWYAVMLTVDTQYKKAMELFPEAIRIAGLK